VGTTDYYRTLDIMADTQHYLKGPLNRPIHFTLLEFFWGEW
jgi:hypothetical protein